MERKKTVGKRNSPQRMQSYDEVHGRAIVEAENLLRNLYVTRDKAKMEVEKYCKDYELVKNMYPPSQRILEQTEITNFSCGSGLTLQYFADKCIYATSFTYDFTQEEQHIVDSLRMPPEFSDHFTAEELGSRTVYRSITFSLKEQNVSERALENNGSIYFEKSVFVGRKEAKETITSIFLTQEDEPGMLIRRSSGEVVDLYPGASAIDGHPVSFCVVHDGTTPYLIEHVRTRCLVQDIVRVENCQSGKKQYYLIPFHAVSCVIDFFVLRGALYYVSNNRICDANNGDIITTLPAGTDRVVSNGEDIAYYEEEKDRIVILHIGPPRLAVGLGFGVGFEQEVEEEIDSVVPGYEGDYEAEEGGDDEAGYGYSLPSFPRP